MDPRKLLYLASVIEHGSFKKAAKHLHISQPALSTSMDRLEESLGRKLLDRGPAGIIPTPLGELIYSHARLIRDEMDLAERQIRSSDDQSEAAITFGTLPDLATSVVPRALCGWREKYPTRLLSVVNEAQLDLIIGLIRGELDFVVGLTEYYGFLDGLKQRVLFRDRLYVIGRPGHPAFRIEAVSWTEPGTIPVILQMFGRQITLLEQLLTSEGVAGLPKQLTECRSVNFIKSLVSESDSLAMLPACAIALDVRDGRIRPLPISGDLLNRNIAIMFRERSPLTTASRDLVDQIEAAGLDINHEELISPE